MIRRATPADADALSALARECFTQTFEYLYAPGDLAIFLDQAYSPAILRSELQDPQRATWLLFEDAVGGPSSPDEASCTPSDLVSSPGPTVHTPGEHPSIPYSGEEAPASFPDGLIGYVTACPTPTSHPATARSSASTSCADTRVGATGPRCCAPRLSGSNATGRAPSGSACGAKTTGHNASTRATASRSSASTPSWSATTPTASSSPAARRASHADRPASKGRQPADANAPRKDWGAGRKKGDAMIVRIISTLIALPASTVAACKNGSQGSHLGTHRRLLGRGHSALSASAIFARTSSMSRFWI